MASGRMGRVTRLRGTRRGEPVVYDFGIIDFLQPYTARKVFERGEDAARGS